MKRGLVFGIVLTAACARAPAPEGAASAVPCRGLGRAAWSGPRPLGAPVPTVTSAAPVADAGAATAAAAPEPPLEGLNFIDEARVVFRVAACGAVGDMPARFDAAVVTKHCDELRRAYADYRKTLGGRRRAVLRGPAPEGPAEASSCTRSAAAISRARSQPSPTRTEITTISLEPAGDIRPVDKLARRLPRATSWRCTASHLERLFEKAHSRTDNLEKESKTELPGEILFALAALVVVRRRAGEPAVLPAPSGRIARVVTQSRHRRGEDSRPTGARSSPTPRCGFGGRATPDAPVQVLRHVELQPRRRAPQGRPRRYSPT